MKTIYQEESKRLKGNIEALKEIINNKNHRLIELENQNKELVNIINENRLIFEDIECKYQKLLNANALSVVNESVDETKKTINNLVREIDTCIALLNK